jgi:hypothetical protein
MKLALLSLAVVSVAFAAGCSQIPVQMHTETHIQHADGTVEHKSSDWHGTLDQLPAQMSKAGRELGDDMSKMAKELTDVPPPGRVQLGDLDPSFSGYQGKRGQDFLSTAKDDKGNAITFEYVRVGQPQFDDFFKTTQEIYALVYQTTQVLAQIKQLKELGSDADDGAKARLQTMTEMARTLATLVPQISSKIGKLVQAGQALIASAPSAIANPKVLAHLDLVKKGLGSSVKVLEESGGLLVGFTKDLSGFKS